MIQTTTPFNVLMTFVATGAFALGCSMNKASEGSTQEDSNLTPNSLIGGNVAAHNEFPATAGMLVENTTPGDPNYLTCTMTKIAPKTFLTAAHCLFPGGSQGADLALRPELAAGKKIRVLFGVYQAFQVSLPAGATASTSVLTRVKALKIHPTWLKKLAPRDDVVEGNSNDVDAALMEVEDPTPAISIAKVDPTPLATGTKVIMAGYGCQFFDNGITGELRKLSANAGAIKGTMTRIKSSETDSTETGSICPGDSGGALFLASDKTHRTIVGVNSRFLSGELLGAQISPNMSWFTRVDTQTLGPKFASFLP